jgi:hypothetical protein
MGLGLKEFIDYVLVGKRYIYVKRPIVLWNAKGNGGEYMASALKGLNQSWD